MSLPSEQTAPPPVWVFTVISAALFLLLFEGGNRAVAHPSSFSSLSSGEGESSARAATSEGEATSSIELTTPGAPPTAVRILQVGNPPRRPTLPDLSRAGRVEFPGRVSFEVGGEGILWDDELWVPPGIYRIALVSDGVEVRLAAQPLAPAAELSLPIETGTMTRPGGAFRATLAERDSEGARVGVFAIRWGALYWEATLTATALTRVAAGSWTLQETPTRTTAEKEVLCVLLLPED